MLGAGVTRNNVDSRRSVTVGGSETLKGSYHADTAQVFTELGYAIALDPKTEIEPYVGLSYQNLHAQGFDESGGDAALSVDSQTSDVTTTTLGLRGKKIFDWGGKQTTVSAGLGWRHAMGDIEPSNQMTFVQGGGTPFTVTGTPLAKDMAVVDLGAEMAVGKNTALGLRYNGQFGDGSTSNNGTVYLRVRFD